MQGKAVLQLHATREQKAESCRVTPLITILTTSGYLVRRADALDAKA